MKAACTLVILIGSFCFGESRLSAQIEATFGYGTATNSLTIRNNGQRALNYDPRAITNIGGVLSVAYRPGARSAIRAIGNFGEREINLGLVGPDSRVYRPSANYYDLSLEYAYYPSPWWSVGAGVGYANNNYRRYYLPNRVDPTFERFQAAVAPQDFTFANLALEYYAGIVTLRAAPSLSLGQAYSKDLQSFDQSGERLPDPKGVWLGLNLSLMVKAPFGKTQYGPTIGFDSLLNRVLAPVSSRLPRWAIGPVFAYDVTGITFESKLNTFSAQPNRLRVGALANYRLNDAWDLRLSGGYARLRWTTNFDSLRQTEISQTQYVSSGAELMFGAERRLFRRIYIGADVGPMLVTSRKAPALAQDFYPNTAPLAAQAPLASVIMYSNGYLTWRAGERLRLGGQVSYTLNNPNGKGVDQRTTIPARRDERWFGVGFQAGWMILRG